MRKNPLTDYGIKIVVRLNQMCQTQNWLIEEVAKKTNMYCDTSLMNRIMTGKSKSRMLINAINEILDIKD